jgi:hypothetical protein
MLVALRQANDGGDAMPTREERAERFIWANARLIDRHLFAYHFKGGSKEPVLATLRAYQNPDGGFGNALEPDKRTPHSQPVDAETALRVLDALDAFDDPMVARLCDFLPTITRPEGGLPFTLPTANPYPHAPWWEAPQEPPAAINPTAAVAGLLRKHRVSHPWVERATAFCWETIETSETVEPHDVAAIVTFLEHALERERAERELRRLRERIAAAGVVEMDPGAQGYVHRPLDWAPWPDSPLRPLFSDDVLRANLRLLADAQREDGGWPIGWEPVSVAVECEWRGAVTIGALRTLRAFEAAGLTAQP